MMGKTITIRPTRYFSRQAHAFIKLLSVTVYGRSIFLLIVVFLDGRVLPKMFDESACVRNLLEVCRRRIKSCHVISVAIINIFSVFDLQNLDSWKSCRRKRVEHIIDRVVEVKKLELEEHDRTRRKSKTFSEMMEDR